MTAPKPTVNKWAPGTSCECYCSCPSWLLDIFPSFLKKKMDRSLHKPICISSNPSLRFTRSFKRNIQPYIFRSICLQVCIIIPNHQHLFISPMIKERERDDQTERKETDFWLIHLFCFVFLFGKVNGKMTLGTNSRKKANQLYYLEW